MNTPISGNPPLNRQVLEEAAKWFVEFREGQPTQRSRQSFSVWMRRSPEHILAYLEVATFWAAAPRLGLKENIDFQALAAAARADQQVVSLELGSAARAEAAVSPNSALWQRHRRDGGVPIARGPSVRRQVFPTRLVASVLAGAVAVSIGAGWWLLSRAPEYRTEIGEHRSVVLADGSQVDLDARSRVRVHFTDRERRIELLEGQAIFQVAKHKERPFSVWSGVTRVLAVGTRFNVNRSPGGTTVTVLEGQVAVLSTGADFKPRRGAAVSSAKEPEHVDVLETPPRPETPSKHQGGSDSQAAASHPLSSDAIYLSSGDQIRINGNSAASPTHASVAVATAWTQRRIVFDSAPLSEVVEEFNRYNSRQMIIEDPRAADIRIAAVFSSTDLPALVQFLRAMPIFRVLETDSDIRIASK